MLASPNDFAGPEANRRYWTGTVAGHLPLYLLGGGNDEPGADPGDGVEHFHGPRPLLKAPWVLYPQKPQKNTKSTATTGGGTTGDVTPGKQRGMARLIYKIERSHFFIRIFF